MSATYAEPAPPRAPIEPEQTRARWRASAPSRSRSSGASSTRSTTRSSPTSASATRATSARRSAAPPARAARRARCCSARAAGRCGSPAPPPLSLAKILENMEIGHNVMHGQWDWMNDPDINSQNWDWDTASPADAWRHSHNYEHHTFTNIRGKDRDLGYEIMRIDPHQHWHPVYLLPAPLQPAADGLLRVGRGAARPQLRRDPHGREVQGAGARGAEGDRPEGAPADRQGLHRLPRALRPPAGAVVRARVARRARSKRPWADFTANIVRNVWAHSIIFCGHFPDQTYTFSQDEVAEETRGGWYVRQLLGSANIDGRPAVSPARRQPLLPGRAPPLPRHALQPLRRDRAARARHLPPLRPALQHRAAAASSSAPCTARSCASRSPAAGRVPSPGPIGPRPSERRRARSQASAPPRYR